jgi:hypothetical protein
MCPHGFPANAPHSGHPDVGGNLHVTVRLSLETDRHFLGLTGLWRFAEKVVGAACWNIRFQLFRTITFNPKATLNNTVISATK